MILSSYSTVKIVIVTGIHHCQINANLKIQLSVLTKLKKKLNTTFTD